MGPPSDTARLEVVVSFVRAEPPEGWVAVGAHDRRPFAGWLDLLHLLEELVAGPVDAGR